MESAPGLRSSEPAREAPSWHPPRAQEGTRRSVAAFEHGASMNGVRSSVPGQPPSANAPARTRHPKARARSRAFWIGREKARFDLISIHVGQAEREPEVLIE